MYCHYKAEPALYVFLQEVRGIFTVLLLPQYQLTSFRNPNMHKQILFCALYTPSPLNYLTVTVNFGDGEGSKMRWPEP